MIEIQAPMEGEIVEVLVNVGDQVNENDEILILEAMKMENPIYASAHGVVKKLLVKEKEKIELGQVLVRIE